jgi:hypothetical protein
MKAPKFGIPHLKFYGSAAKWPNRRDLPQGEDRGVAFPRPARDGGDAAGGSRMLACGDRGHHRPLDARRRSDPRQVSRADRQDRAGGDCQAGEGYQMMTNVQMKLSTAAIILLSSITISFAGTFAPESGCVSQCLNLFDVCLKVCGNDCLSTSIIINPPTTAVVPTSPGTPTPPPPSVARRNCDVERDTCVRNCPTSPGE